MRDMDKHASLFWHSTNFNEEKSFFLIMTSVLRFTKALKFFTVAQITGVPYGHQSANI
jgi:hypothetical protein